MGVIWLYLKMANLWRHVLTLCFDLQKVGCKPKTLENTIMDLW